MKEELQGKLVEIITGIQHAVGKAADFTMSQLPDIAQSYILYGRMMSLIQTVALVAVGFSLMGYSYWAYKNPWNLSTWSFEKDRVRSDSNISAITIPVLVGIILLAIAVGNFNYLVWFAPKVWLLKEIATLLK